MAFLEHLNKLADKIGLPPYTNVFSKVDWPLRKGEVPERPYLYHYTSQEAAFQILETRTVRATDAHFLNDTEEVLLGRRALEAALNKFPLDSREHATFSSAVDFLLAADKPENYQATSRKRGRAYVVSFSTKKDDLRQWQTYGRNGGVSLGFSPSLLAQTQPDAILAPVVYGEVSELTALFYEDMRSILDPVSSLEAEKRRQALIRRYALFTALTKSPDFDSENEWRLVLTEAQVNRQSASWRQASDYAIPYLTLALWKGGKPSKMFNAQMPVKQLRSAYGGCHVIIRKDADPLIRYYYDSKSIPVHKSQVTLRG